MKLLFTTAVIFLFCFKVSASEVATNKASVEPNKAEACSSCHNSMINLKGRGVDVIIKQSKAIQAAEKSHPPTGISELSDKDVAEIAAYLNIN